jgi:hypothetical protein
MYAAVLLVLVSALVAVAAVVFSSHQAEDPPSNKQLVQAAAEVAPSLPNTGLVLPVVDLNGSWKMTTDNGGTFVATVTSETIKILMVSPKDVSMVYWYGTFKSNGSAGDEITSEIIQVDKAVLSMAKNKRFIVGDDTLTFSFTAMGVTKSVELRRG